MSFFYLHTLEALTMRNVVFLTVQIYIQFQFRYINHSQKTVQKSKISHEITNHTFAISSRLQRSKSVTGKTASHENKKKTFTETFDRIKFKQNPDKIVPNISSRVLCECS